MRLELVCGACSLCATTLYQSVTTGMTCFCVLILVGTVALSKASDLEQSVGAPESKRLSIVLATGLYTGHLFPLVSLGEELVRRGHNVTLCANVMKGSHLYPGVPERVGVKFVSAGYDALFTQELFEEISLSLKDGGLINSTIFELIGQIGTSSHLQIKTKVEEMGIHHFDFLISEISTFPVAAYFHKRGMKVAVFSTLMYFPPPILPSWSTPLPSMPQTDDLSFLERFFNTFFLGPFFGHFMKKAFESVHTDSDYKKVLGNEDIMSFPGLRIPLIMNTVQGFTYPLPKYPLVDYVGPVLSSTSEEMNQELQEWLDSKADRTVIYISMGTTGFLNADSAEGLLKGVMTTPYSAVWVISSKNRQHLTQVNFAAFQDRFYLAEWIPQQTVLQHKSILMTILHCGLNGVQESLYNLLPVICIPFSYDQYEVATKLSSAGAGVSLITFTDSILGRRVIEADTVSSAIEQIISNDYVKNVSKIRRMYDLAGGAKRAADLVELYADVGYEHLVPSFVKYQWSWVQYYNADVLLVLSVACSVLVWSAWMVGRCVCRKVCQNSTKT